MRNGTSDIGVRAKLRGWARWWTCMVMAGCGAIFDGAAARAVSLDQVRAAVQANEALTSLVKLDYEVEYGPTRTPVSTGPRKAAGEPFTGYKGTWAQDGIRQHNEYDYLRGSDNVASQQLQVVTGEVAINAKKPGLMQGSIQTIEQHDWEAGPPLRGGTRPFEDELLLSDSLKAPGTTASEKTEQVRGRETWVVVGEARRCFFKAFIDCERGLPLRIEGYNNDPRVTGSPGRFTLLDILDVQRLPNGGWLAVRSERALGADGAAKSWYRVDVNSVTIERKNIPESLFRVDFPDGAQVVNTITGTVTRGNRTLPWDSTLEAEAKLATDQVVGDSLQGLSAVAPDVPDNTVVPRAASDVRSGYEHAVPVESDPRSNFGWRLLILVALATVFGGLTTLIAWAWWNRNGTAKRR